MRTELRDSIAVTGWENVDTREANAGDIREQVQSLGWEDSPGGGHGNPLQYSFLEKPMDRGTWWAAAHGVTKSGT